MRRAMVSSAAAGLLIFMLASAAHSQTIVDGKQLFDKRCGGCHALDRDKEGPRLRGVYGRAAASVPSFSYSEALKSAKFSWTNETLDKWLTDTESVVPHNDMAFHVQSAEERKAIIAFLKQNSAK